jgi:hypothetical protein
MSSIAERSAAQLKAKNAKIKAMQDAKLAVRFEFPTPLFSVDIERKRFSSSVSETSRGYARLQVDLSLQTIHSCVDFSHYVVFFSAFYQEEEAMLAKANTPKSKPLKKPAAAASAVSTAFSKGSADEKAAKEADANAERRESLKAKVENDTVCLFVLPVLKLTAEGHLERK